MGIITASYFVDFLIGFCTLLAVLYKYLSSKNKFWKKHGIPYVEPDLIFGNIKGAVLGRKNILYIQQDIYKQLDGHKFGGYYELVTPSLLIRDPELIDRILIKDFAHFTDRGFGGPDPENEPLSAALINLNGSQWRNMRHKLTPTFTSGKLKGMFEQIYNCGDELLAELQKYAESGEEFQAKTVLSLFTSDVIASCAFGLQFNHDSEGGKEFRKMVDKVSKPSKTQMLRFLVFASFKKIAQLMKLRRFDPVIAGYFINIVKSTMDFRKQNNIKRNDFLQLLMGIREQEKSGKSLEVNQELKGEDAYLNQGSYNAAENSLDGLELSDGVLAAQAFVFMAVGAETTSGSLTYILFALATDPEVQQRAQQEVQEMLEKNGGCNYQAIRDMTYLDQVVQEGLRRYPFAPTLNRVVTSPYQLPGTDIILQKGRKITIPVYPIHMDPAHYPDPERFDPERFKDNNHRPSSKYLPFGDGPRMCIAMRFAVLEMKVCLARILSRYSLCLSDKTSLPMEFDPANPFISGPKGRIWLRVKSTVT